MSSIKNLEGLFQHMLQDMLYAENKITKALPKMIKKTSDENLKAGLEQHLEETKDQIGKLEEVFEICGFDKKREKCEAIEGLIKEGESLMDEVQNGPTLDAALIAAAQKVEHYEIATYGALCHMANKLGQKEAAKLLHEILEQEKATDEKLIDLSDGIEEESMKQAA